MLDVLGRTPLGIRHIEHFMLSFDAEGRIDTNEWDREIQLVGEMVDSHVGESLDAKLVDARGRFARKRYFHEFKWIPTPRVKENIITTIFGKELA